jgi:cytoskeletal protein CcmA (bactofilin family)
MALWKEPEKSSSSTSSDSTEPASIGSPDSAEKPVHGKSSAASTEPARAGATSASESHIAPDLVIEGKVEGAGHVHIAGRFKGDVNVRGDLTIEDGANVEGSVRAERVTVAGDLTGNIESAMHVELMETGALTGDVKSKTFSVAKGSKMRGQAEFGWDDGKSDFHGTRKSAATDIHKSDRRAEGNGSTK